jgi:hypothetical protein
MTGIRDAWSSVPVETQVQWWREILAGKRVGSPRQLLSGTPLVQDRSRERAQELIDSLKARGANFIKVYPYSSMLAAAARRGGIPFGGHMVSVDFMVGGYKAAPECAMEASDSGMRIFDHVNPSKLSNFCFLSKAR